MTRYLPLLFVVVLGCEGTNPGAGEDLEPALATTEPESSGTVRGQFEDTEDTPDVEPPEEDPGPPAGWCSPPIPKLVVVDENPMPHRLTPRTDPLEIRPFELAIVEVVFTTWTGQPLAGQVVEFSVGNGACDPRQDGERVMALLNQKVITDDSGWASATVEGQRPGCGAIGISVPGVPAPDWILTQGVEFVVR